MPNGDRQFVILPKTAHSPGYGKNRHLLWYAIKNFLAAPAPIAASYDSHIRRDTMKIVQGDELEWVRGLEYRGGTFHYRNLMEGTAGTIDNFQLSMGRNDKDFVSPRHRHNFEQFRFQLEGDLNFARDGIMTPGMVGYFPEGTSYGPQTSEGTATTFVLQFGGSSGQGYLSRKEVKQGMDALRTTGTFDGGIYRRNEGEPGKRNMDGFQAIWEHGQRPAAAIPEAALRQAGDDGPGGLRVGRRRRISRACTRSCSACSPSGAPKRGLFRLDAGATLTGSGRGVYLAYRGGGRVDGQPLRPLTTVFLERGETASFVGRAGDRAAAFRPARSARA